MEIGNQLKSEKPASETYTVTIEEHISGEFHVMAGDIFQALELAEKKYRQDEFVVLPSPPTARLIMAENDETGDATEWKEF